MLLCWHLSICVWEHCNSRCWLLVFSLLGICFVPWFLLPTLVLRIRDGLGGSGSRRAQEGRKQVSHQDLLSSLEMRQRVKRSEQKACYRTRDVNGWLDSEKWKERWRSAGSLMLLWPDWPVGPQGAPVGSWGPRQSDEWGKGSLERKNWVVHRRWRCRERGNHAGGLLFLFVFPF